MTLAWIFVYIGVGTAVSWFMRLVDWIDREYER
jgi:hypothetical protein|nr:MAG TPA: hypothetical protein [Caudoviricetes sp.]